MNNGSEYNSGAGMKSIKEVIPSKQTIFWFGFIIYWVALIFYSLTEKYYVLFQSFQLLGIVIFLPPAIMMITPRIGNSYLRIIFSLYCLWTVFLLISGFPEFKNTAFLKLFLFNPKIGWLYLAPLIVLIPLTFDFLRSLFKTIIIFGFLFIAFSIMNIGQLLQSNSDRISIGIIETLANLSFGSGFILLTFKYHKKRVNFLALFCILFTLFVAVVQARRGLILMFSTILLSASFFYFYFAKSKILLFYLASFLVLLGSLFFTDSRNLDNINYIDFLRTRGLENTREGVEIDFYKDMSTKEWIIGKGINGKYFSPGIEEEQDTYYRDLVETGYLQTILKGGLIHLSLFLFIAVPAILNGFFNSRNLLCKAAATWILLVLIHSYPTIISAFTLNYLICWICIGICYSSFFRKIDNNTIAKELSI